MEDIQIALAVVNSVVGRIEDNLMKTDRWARAAREEGACLVCFPELNLTGYGIGEPPCRHAQPVSGSVADRLQAIAERENIVLVAGMAEQGPGGRIFAAQLVVRPGRPFGIYRKTHIAPPEIGRLDAGDAVPLFDLGDLRFGIQLCYDAHFPGLSTRMAMEGADLVLMPHASPRGTPREKLESWSRHLPARAFDNGVFVAACNPIGGNGEGLDFPGAAVVYGPNGRRIASRCFHGEGLLVCRLEASLIDRVRGHRMRYFLPHQRTGLYPPGGDGPGPETSSAKQKLSSKKKG
ncbi:MAG: nitrilase-related carbon-nitrogen hydrolase [Desulfobacterales bacterium]